VWNNPPVTDRTETQSSVKQPLILAIFLIFAGVVGLISAFALTLDKIAVLTNPDTELDCNFSVLVQCGKNLASWQGSIFGFPNPLIGIIGFTVVIVIGVLLASRVQLPKWMWIGFNAGVVLALAFVIFLISQSIFVLGTLCPWCMVVWFVTIPMFFGVTLYNLKEGHFGASAGAQKFFAGAYGWVPFIALACYVVIAVLAQVRLDVLAYL
jgi:uncharacterized membrane protein